jgi:hypothetical protein
VVAVGVVALLLGEAWVRLVSEQLPTVRAGDAAEMVLKAKQIDTLAAQSRDVDVVFFGTSMMDSAVNPDVYMDSSRNTSRVYNAGVVGAPSATQVRWANEIVLDRLHPKTIVLGIHPLDLLLTDVLNLNIQPAQADVIFGRVLRETEPGIGGDLQRWFYDHSELVRQRGSLRRPYVMAEATWNEVRGNKPKAFIALRDEAFWQDHLSPLGESSLFHGEQFKVTGVADQIKTNLRADAFSVDDVHRLLQVATDSGDDVKVIVVIPPIPVGAWVKAGIDLTALRQGEQIITEIAKSYGAEVIDFTDRGYQPEDFADLVHSNERGAERFSRELAAAVDSINTPTR